MYGVSCSHGKLGINVLEYENIWFPCHLEELRRLEIFKLNKVRSFVVTGPIDICIAASIERGV